MFNRSTGQALVLISQLAISVMVPTILLTLLGMWLCNKFGWSSWVTFALMLLGMFSGLRSAIIMAKGVIAADELERKKKEAARRGRDIKDL